MNILLMQGLSIGKSFTKQSRLSGTRQWPAGEEYTNKGQDFHLYILSRLCICHIQQVAAKNDN